MVDEIQPQGSVGGDDQVGLGARFLASLFDLVIIPIVLGVIFGFIFFNAPTGMRNTVLVFVNVVWTCFRDLMGGAGPGKRMAGIKVVDANGNAPSIVQLVIRNVLLWIPFVLIVGFIIESVMIFILRKDRLGDRFAKCKVVSSR